MSVVESEETWLRILRDQCKKSSIQEVADAIGYKRPSISLVLSGKYNGSTRNIAAAVIEKFTDYIPCPHLNDDITNADCKLFQSIARPTSDPNELRHWMACRTGCPHSTFTLEGEIDHA